MQVNRDPSIQETNTIENPLAELFHFREKTSPFHQQPFSDNRVAIKRYQSIFLFLGILFLGLSITIFIKNPNWACPHILGNCQIIKVLVAWSSALLSFFSFLTALKLKIEKEAAKQIKRAALGKLLALYRLYSQRLDSHFFPYFSHNYEKIYSLRKSYRIALQKIEIHQIETQKLIERIKTSGQLEELQREKLLNQALLEFKNQLAEAVLEFNIQNSKLTLIKDSNRQ